MKRNRFSEPVKIPPGIGYNKANKNKQYNHTGIGKHMEDRKIVFV
jgi:hypothetical protein